MLSDVALEEMMKAVVQVTPEDEMICGRSSVVELQPSKLVVVGSNPIARSTEVPPPSPPRGRGHFSRPKRDGANAIQRAAVAQSVEHFLGKEEVTGSIPVSSSIFEMQPCRGRSPASGGQRL